MDINNPFYIEVIQTLDSSGVKFIMIGGLAVSYHGYARYTGDMDLWLAPEPDNLQRLYHALQKLGYPIEAVNHIKENRPPEHPTPIRLTDDNNLLKVDLMTNTFQEQFSWSECHEACETITIEATPVPIIHINHLIQLKENTKRLDSNMKDLVDAEELKKIKKLRDEGKI